MTTFFECLFDIKKSPEEIKREIEHSNEHNYRKNKRLVNNEAYEFKQKHKEMIEYRLKKPITQVTLEDLYLLGFNSENLTRKHCEEIFEVNKNGNKI